MPTISLIQQLDRLLEPGATTSKTTTLNPNNDVLNDASPKLERGYTTSSSEIPPPHPHLRRRNSVSLSLQFNHTTVRPQMTPALYTTPEPTPLPVSPTSSFPPSSPFLINHKRRGPRLSKSFSDQNVATLERNEDTNACVRRPCAHINETCDKVSGDDVAVAEVVDENGLGNGGTVEVGESEAKGTRGSSWEREGGESDDFFDPQESMSFSSSIDTDDYGAERSAKANTPMGEFYDAWEELSSDSGQQAAQRSLGDVETELREMRLTLLMEIEKRKQVEEAVHSMQSQWQMLREKLGTVGVVLPADLAVSVEGSQSDVSLTEEICQQIHLARVVSESIGRGIARAEVEAEMEAQLEVKNFEIARLCDRLHYYETMNREMSQRNQEAVEIARRERQKRRRRQKWVWGSIATAITLGSAALAWSYLPGLKGSSATKYLEASEPDSDVQ